MSDLSIWDIASDFTGEVASALVLGIDPSQAGYERARSNPVCERMKQHYNAAKRLHQEMDQQCDDPPEMDKPMVLESIDLQWCLTNEDPEDGAYFPRWLRDIKLSGFETQRFTRKEIARWLLVIGIKSRYQFDVELATLSKLEKPIGAKERAYLLKLVIGMAIDGYGYDSTSVKSPIPLELANILASLGMSITDDTVRKYLNEAKELVLPKKPPSL